VQRSDGRFTALIVFNMGSSFARKSPLASIAAFGDDPSTRLVIKASNPQLYDQGFAALLAGVGGAKNIELITAPLSPAQMGELYAQADVVMSLHRSEGFGFVVAEAMLYALPGVGGFERAVAVAVLVLREIRQGQRRGEAIETARVQGWGDRAAWPKCH
jgi:hypothetical protein